MNEATLQELNEIQEQWMSVDSTGPRSEINRVCKLMERLPRRYVSGHDGFGVVIDGGTPLMQPIPFSDAITHCRALGGRTDVAWNGQLGKWYALNA